MIGVLFSVIAGAVMSLQGVINTRLSEKIGILEANLFVQGTAFLLSFLALLIFGRGNLPAIRGTKWTYLIGGVLGLVITVTVILSIKGLSPTAAVSIILIAQLLTAALIDLFGWLGTEKAPFGWQKFVGLALMIGGIVLFKWRAIRTN
ncbi:MAG: DMT family transporter [Clostridia bacterium]|nr:DMT family transporter [Clostridia bacterium]MBR5044476.1 DMT family transporter [Clostridia bacterium]